MSRKLSRSSVLECIDILNNDSSKNYESNVESCLRRLCNCDLVETVPENFDLIDAVLRLTGTHLTGPIAQYVLRRWERAGTSDTNIGLPDKMVLKITVHERKSNYLSDSPLVDGIPVTKKSKPHNSGAKAVSATKYLTHIKVKQ